jgi:3-hydroxy-3-methylglutaryl CoA synthase
MGSRIVATGRALPRTAVTNSDLARVMDTSDEWIRTRTGIARRYVMASGESLVDIAAAASKTALERAGWKSSLPRASYSCSRSKSLITCHKQTSYRGYRRPGLCSLSWQ